MSPFAILALLFAIAGIGGLIAHIILRQRFFRVLFIGCGACAVFVLLFLVLWAKEVFKDVPDQNLVLWTFLLGGIAFGGLLVYPFLTRFKVLSRIDLVVFFSFAIAFIVCAVFLSKYVLAPQSMVPESSSSFLFPFL